MKLLPNKKLKFAICLVSILMLGIGFKVNQAIAEHKCKQAREIGFNALNKELEAGIKSMKCLQYQINTFGNPYDCDESARGKERRYIIDSNKEIADKAFKEADKYCVSKSKNS